MKAVYIAEPGGPEKLIFGDRPDPHAGPGEVVVLADTARAHEVMTGRDFFGKLVLRVP